jgi:ABC-type amino acid transport substrate-binding protein
VQSNENIPPLAEQQLTSDGVLRVGVNYGNPNNASRDASGTLRGVAIDLACAVAADLNVDIAFSAYSGIPPLLQGFDRGEWTVGFTATTPTLATAHPHLGVENTYLVAGSPPSCEWRTLIARAFGYRSPKATTPTNPSQSI